MFGTIKSLSEDWNVDLLSDQGLEDVIFCLHHHINTLTTHETFSHPAPSWKHILGL